MTRRLPPATPLSLAERERDYQQALEIALVPRRTPQAPGLVGRVRNLFAPAAPTSHEIYRRDVAWRPLLNAEGTETDIQPPSPRTPARPRATFLSRRLR